MIVMDSKSQLTVVIVAKVAMGKMDIVNAAKLLNKSRRTIERYLKKYQQVGIQFIIIRQFQRIEDRYSLEASIKDSILSNSHISRN